MKKESKKNNQISFISLTLSILLIAISIIIKKATVIRAILWILSIFLLTLNIVLSNKIKITKTIIIFLVLLISSFFIDGIIVYTFKKVPVFYYNTITSENSIVYNSIGVRVWQCDKNDFDNLIIDPFYEKGYMCNAEDITPIDSNSFLNSIVENHDDYYNKYVKITGKISKTSGQNYIEMRPYSTSEITVNGYVEFADNITLKIIFNTSEPSLDNYDIYDEITIVGVIKNLENSSSKYTVYMYDSKIVSSLDLDEHTITITSSKSCSTDQKLIYSNDKSNIYTYCIDEAIVSYPYNKYELPQALSSNKISIEELYSGSDDIIKNTENNSMIYRFEDYSILVCDQSLSKDIIIGHKKLSFEDVKCQSIVEE